MKIRINKEGYLEIYRKNKWKIVECPYCQESRDYCYDYEYNPPYIEKVIINYKYCGDWCSLFGEPTEQFTYNKVTRDFIHSIDKIELKLCKNIYVVDKENFEDLR